MPFATGRVFMFALLSLFSFFILMSLQLAKKTRVNVRPIPALDSLHECVGRAVELGRPVHWTTGYGSAMHGGGGLLSPALISGLAIFTHIARLCAQMGAELYATFCVAELMPPAMQAVREIYSVEGKEELFKSQNFIYFSPSQFAYATGVISFMETQQVATNILCGQLQDECILLAETGATIGAVQVGGGGQYAYLMITCQYLLIGEEFYTAAAYLSQDQAQLGSIRGQDFGKITVIFLFLGLSILLMLGIDLTGVFKI